MTTAQVSEFRVDCTLYLQRKDLPTYQKAASAYAQTIPNAPLNIEFRQQKPGVFIVKTFTEVDAKKLVGKYITFYYGKNEQCMAKVVLEKLPKYIFYSNPKWVSIDWLNDGNLRYVENEQLNTFLSEYGDIIVGVEYEKNELGMLNGRRKARLDMNKGKHIERVKWVDFDVTIEDGTVQNAKGKAKFFYQSQPVFCKRCSKEHDKKCPAQIKEEEILKEYEVIRKEKCTSFTISDSELRHVNEKALFSDTDVSSGAKIGHVVNVLKNTELDEYKNVILNVGINNINSNGQVDFEKWHSQLKNEVGGLREVIQYQVAAGKNIRICPVPEAPITKSTAQATMMQKTINDEFIKIAESLCKTRENAVKMVNIHYKTEDEAFSDNKHYSEVQTAIALECIDESLPKDAKMINRERPKGVLLTTPRIYSGVYSTYRFGCGKCTKIGHCENKCKLNLEKISSADNPNKTKRSERLSSSDGQDKKRNKAN